MSPKPLQPRSFHRRGINWNNVAIGVIIPVIAALLIGSFAAVKDAWAQKANLADILRIEKKIDDIQLRVTQIQCGKRVEDGCR